MKKWDHFVTDLSGDIAQEQQDLNSISKDGWELVSIVIMHLCRRAYFKRKFTEKIPDPPPEYNAATVLNGAIWAECHCKCHNGGIMTVHLLPCKCSQCPKCGKNIIGSMQDHSMEEHPEVLTND